MPRLTTAALVLSLLAAAAEPPPDTSTIHPRYTRLAADTGAFDWQGGNGRTDFVQWTDTLGGWRYLPLIRHGEADNSIGLDADASRFFLRIYPTNKAIPTGKTAETADFDGDGLSNLYELLHGRDPMIPETTPVDSDADGLLDTTEEQLGTDPAREDNPAVKLSVAITTPGLPTNKSSISNPE